MADLTEACIRVWHAASADVVDDDVGPFSVPSAELYAMTSEILRTRAEAAASPAPGCGEEEVINEYDPELAAQEQAVESAHRLHKADHLISVSHRRYPADAIVVCLDGKVPFVFAAWADAARAMHHWEQVL